MPSRDPEELPTVQPTEPTVNRASEEARPAPDDAGRAAQEASGEGGRPPASVLNPEAGSYAITADPRELRAALRAGEQTWGRFPYYELRYGERGRRFTGSDSAWIVTLAEVPPAVAEGQLRWLGEVLAARGMPRWLLETHLEALYLALVAEVPERQTGYETLRQIAETLRAERQRHLDEAAFMALAEAFQQRADPAWAAKLPEAGMLIVAAVADERAGIGQAVPSLLAWLADPARFPPAWIDAVTWTVEAARERPAGGPPPTVTE
jgi:hypothetical protein